MNSITVPDTLSLVSTKQAGDQDIARRPGDSFALPTPMQTLVSLLGEFSFSVLQVAGGRRPAGLARGQPSYHGATGVHEGW